MEDEKDDVENTIKCSNCKYFNNYYAHNNGKFHRLPSGYCINCSLGHKKSVIFVRQNCGCEFWEPIQLKKIEEKQSIFKTLVKMQKTLFEIQQILEEDKDC